MAEKASGTYIPGHKTEHIKHQAWRTAENSAAYLLPVLEAMRQEKPDLKMLDVGAGPGTLAATFAQRLLPDGHVLATDLSEEVLKKAKDHAEDMKLTNMSFQAADIFHLPFEDASFDVVHAHQVLVHLPDPPVAALRELLRVTRPGGIVAVRDGDLEMWSFWPATKGLTMWHEMVLKTHTSGGGSTQAGRRLLGWALAAGAKREAITASSATWTYASPEEKKMWSSSLASRLMEGPTRETALKIKAATPEDLDFMKAAWDEWAEAPEGVQMMVNGELLIKK